MQRNSIIGNVAKIMVKNAEEKWESVQSVKGGEKGTKVFVNIADHYWSKNKGEQITRFVPMQGFVPRNLTIQVGMLVDAEFVINTYAKDGIANVSMDITHWDGPCVPQINSRLHSRWQPVKQHLMEWQRRKCQRSQRKRNPGQKQLRKQRNQQLKAIFSDKAE